MEYRLLLAFAYPSMRYMLVYSEYCCIFFKGSLPTKTDISQSKEVPADACTWLQILGSDFPSENQTSHPFGVDELVIVWSNSHSNSLEVLRMRGASRKELNKAAIYPLSLLSYLQNVSCQCFFAVLDNSFLTYHLNFYLISTAFRRSTS